jgi:hypothetical protein
MPRSQPMPAHRRRSRMHLTSTLKATVRGSSPWRRTPTSPAQARQTVGPSSFTGEVGAHLGHTLKVGEAQGPSSGVEPLEGPWAGASQTPGYDRTRAALYPSGAPIAAALPSAACPTRLVVTLDGPHPSPERAPSLPGGAALVLTGRAICVPFRARRLWFATVSHGHS